MATMVQLTLSTGQSRGHRQGWAAEHSAECFPVLGMVHSSLHSGGLSFIHSLAAVHSSELNHCYLSSGELQRRQLSSSFPGYRKASGYILPVLFLSFFLFFKRKKKKKVVCYVYPSFTLCWLAQKGKSHPSVQKVTTLQIILSCWVSKTQNTQQTLVVHYVLHAVLMQFINDFFSESIL